MGSGIFDGGFAGLHDFHDEIVKGNIPGHEDVLIVGAKVDIGTTEITLWAHDANVVFPSTATVMTVSSNNANDTSGGTGARTILIRGLNATGNKQLEVIEMNGQTAVSTVLSYTAINNIDVLTAGSTMSNQGNIYIGEGTVTSGEPAIVYNIMGSTTSQSNSGVFVVPTGENIIIKDVIVNVDPSKNVNLFFTIIRSGVKIEQASAAITQTIAFNNPIMGRKFLPGDKMILSGKATAGSATAQALFSLRGYTYVT